MNVFQIIILVALLGNAAIGLLVLGINPKRRVNRYFLLTTLLISVWLVCMFAITLQPPGELLRWTRLVSAAAVLLPFEFFILRLVIMEPEITFGRLCYRLRYLLLAATATILLCLTPFFARATYFTSPEETIPVSDYGPGMYFYIAYFVGVIISMVVSIRHTLRTVTGVQRTESQFLLLGGVLSFSFGLSLFAASIIWGAQEFTRFLPLFALIMDGVVAYGIATRRILSASVVLQRVISYTLMAVYLVLLYVAAEWVGRLLFRHVVADPIHLSHLLAALVVAFSVAPAHGWMQTVAHRLFASADSLDMNALLARAGRIFREVSTEDDLLANFSDLISDVFGASRVMLLRAEGEDRFIQAYPETVAENPVMLPASSGLIELLRQDRQAHTLYMLERMRSNPEVDEVLAVMKAAAVAVAVGSFMRGEMKAVLMLSAKKSGRIYDLHDQQALQVLCGQFAVALENANLYTAVQNGKIYNEILLDSLTSGIVAVDSNRNVTVFNKRAQKLTGLSEEAVVGRSLNGLPSALAESLDTIMTEQSGFRDRDMTLRCGDEDVPLRVSGSTFHSLTGHSLGGLLVFNDMTLLRKMEEQIRRTDRLSSIGTLSAGMAHEIKNPLVTIKTFAQLLPEQHQDSEFRNTFFDLVGQEVRRIDTIVNRLLNFARPSPPKLRPTGLHAILDNSLRLVGPQLAPKKIKLEQHLDAAWDRIDADSEQLNQTFINFFLNALQAMGPGGTLTVRTLVVPHSPGALQIAGQPDGDRIEVDVQDTGCGIEPDHLSKIFDPFFTTKDTGAGLGLSVSYGIVQEHGGTIDVESEKDRGTVFRMQFPLLPQSEQETA